MTNEANQAVAQILSPQQNDESEQNHGAGDRQRHDQ